MLRHALAKSAPKFQNGLNATRAGSSGRRWYAAATSAQKRALDKAQLEGQGKDSSKPDSPSSTPPTGAAAPGGSDGGDNTMPIAIGVAALVAAGGGAYYYFGKEKQPAKKPASPEKKEKEEKKEEKKEKKKEEKKEPPRSAVQKEPSEPTSVKADDGSNRVIQIKLPLNEGKRGDPSDMPAVSHPAGGNRVTGLPQSAMIAPVSTTVSVKDSLKELQASIEKETSEVAKRANEEAMRSFDTSLFDGLDDLDREQLKARALKLASEMHERTRWEALRLKEFLTLKEKEVADK